MTRKNPHKRILGLSRRELLRYGAATTAGVMALGPLGRLWMPEVSGAPLPNHKRAIIFFCYGGYDGLNMLVPYQHPDYYARRPGIAIAQGNTIALNDKVGYAFNNTLPNLAAHYNAGDGAVFQKVGYPDGHDLSHFNSQDFYSWGVRNGFTGLPITESGWIARYADLYAPTPTGAVSVGVGRPVDLTGGSTNPLMADSLSSFDFEVDGAYQTNHAHRIETVKKLVSGYSGGGLDEEAATALDQGHALASQIQDAVDNFTEPTGPAYPTSTPGRYFKDIARLIQAGFDTQIFFTGFSGWDNHGNELVAMGSVQERLDSGLHAFIEHLKEMGLWNDTVIMIVSEFGRRIFENGSNGTDHGHGNCFFGYGGNVNQGYYGPDLTDQELATENWLDSSIDFRDLYREVVERHLGQNPTPVFPEPQTSIQTFGFLPSI